MSDVFKVFVEKENHNHLCANPMAVYECLIRCGIEVETAIDASSWCELACFDEVYEDYYDRFNIELVTISKTTGHIIFPFIN